MANKHAEHDAPADGTAASDAWQRSCEQMCASNHFPLQAMAPALGQSSGCFPGSLCSAMAAAAAGRGMGSPGELPRSHLCRFQINNSGVGNSDGRLGFHQLIVSPVLRSFPVDSLQRLNGVIFVAVILISLLVCLQECQQAPHLVHPLLPRWREEHVAQQLAGAGAAADVVSSGKQQHEGSQPQERPETFTPGRSREEKAAVFPGLPLGFSRRPIKWASGASCRPTRSTGCPEKGQELLLGSLPQQGPSRTSLERRKILALYSLLPQVLI